MSETVAPPNIIQIAIEYIPEELRREFADILSDERAKAGPGQAEKLAQTAPEDRTWPDGLVELGWGMTDLIDGLLTEDLSDANDKENIEADREGDRKHVLPQFKVLAENGEIPEFQYKVKIRREQAMKVVRWAGRLMNKSQKSLQVNRAKTVIDMGTLAAAHSTLAEKEDLIRWGAAAGTGASLTGLFETIFQYAKKDKTDEEPLTARNSMAREISAGPVGRIAELIDQYAPGVTPSHLTKAGEVLVESGAALVAAKPNHPVLPTIMHTVGSLLDVLDGALARFKKIAGIKGMVEDIQADLRQQMVTLSMLSVTAMRRGNKVAAANYAIATMAMPLSALTRAQAESRGLVVAEGGLGTRVGRGILSGIGIAFNRDRDISDTVSATLVASTLNTVYERQHVLKHGADSEYCVGTKKSRKFIREAKIREQAILPYALAGMAVGAALLAGNQSGVVEDTIGLESDLAAQ